MKHTYYYDGINIVKEEWGNNTMVFLYDSNGSPVGMQYRNSSMSAGEWETYLYEKNLQGDIVAIYNASGAKLANYTYDAWGRILSITDGNNQDVTDNASHIGNINPMRYRGYYYDSDLDLYYLATRYYDPITCRFITADDPAVLTATPMGLTDKNLFAYCDNNPITRVDNGGQFWNIVAGAVIGGGLELAGQLLSGISLSEVNWAKIGVSAVSGALTAAVGPVAGFLISGATDVAMDALDGNINRDRKSVV